MSHSLSGYKVAIVVGNGFHQNDLTDMQKAVMAQGGTPRIISCETGLVNGWVEGGWGHNFAVEEPLSTALGSDFDALVIPGGERSIQKLKLTPHSKRFLNSFFNAGKPLALMDEAVSILAHSDHMAGKTMTAPAVMKDMVVAAGAVWDDNNISMDDHLMSVTLTDETRADVIGSIIAFFAEKLHANAMMHAERAA